MKTVLHQTNLIKAFFIFLGWMSLGTMNAQIRVPFTPRTAFATPSDTVYSIQGDFTLIGNTNMTLQNYSDITLNSNNVMIYVDADTFSSTLNSSSAMLQYSTENGAIPECSRVKFAGLYWTGRAHDGSSSPNTFTVNGIDLDKRKVLLKGPGISNYTEITARAGDIYYPQNSDGYMYSAFAEVTDYVRQNGLGEYTIANIALREGNGGPTGYYGGWGLIVVYENSQMNWRDITIFDGHAYVAGNVSAQFELPVSGFNTAQAGPINMKLGMIAGEGDVGINRDYFEIIDQSNNFIRLNHSGNATNNFFNSSVVTGGNLRNPSILNNTGLDIAMFNISNPGNSVITNNQTSTRFRYGSNQDTYIIFCIAMSVDAYIPDVTALISTETIDGVPVGSGPITVSPRQVIQYSVDIRNEGTEAVDSLHIIVPLPFLTSFVTGSEVTQINFSPTPSPDTVSFEPTFGPTGAVVWHFGTLPIIPGHPDSVLATLTFSLTVTEDCFLLTNPDCPPVVTITGGHVTGVGAVSGSDFNLPFIQGYESSGLCIGEPITDQLQLIIDADAFILANCTGFPIAFDTVFCAYTDTIIPVNAIAGNFPPGFSFYNSNSVTPFSIKYDATNPFPATLGTVEYYAIPPGTDLCFFAFTISVQEPLVTTETVTHLSCYAGSDGDATISLNSGIGAFTYLWSNGQTDSTAVALTAGTYTVTVTDEFGCTFADTAILLQPDSISL